MKAIRIHRFGGPEVLTLEDVPMPEPSPEELVLRVHAASVNPVDYKIRSGGFLGEDKLPMVMGRDVAGRVASVGSAAADQAGMLKVGDAGYAMLSAEHGGYAEYALVKAGEIAAMPTSLNFVRAAAVPLAALTAWQGLFDEGGLTRGQRVLIHGASGGVGHFAVQFAKARGATVYATATSREQDFLRRIGADTAIDYRAQRFEQIAYEIDVVLDLIGGETQDRSWSVLKPGGVIVSTLTQPNQDRAREHQARGTHFVARPNGSQLREITRLIDNGQVNPEVSVILPLADAAKAQQQLEKEHPHGKMVLRVAA